MEQVVVLVVVVLEVVVLAIQIPEAQHQVKDMLVVLDTPQDKIILAQVVAVQAEQALTELLLPVAQAAQEHYLHQQVLIMVAVVVVETITLQALVQQGLVV
jgi:hypothetical protein